MADKVRYTMALPKQTADILDELSEMDSSTKPELIRKALGLYNRVYLDCIVGDKRLFIVDEKNDKKTEFIFS